MPLTPAEKQKRYRARKSNAVTPDGNVRGNARQTNVPPVEGMTEFIETNVKHPGFGIPFIADPDQLAAARALGRRLGEDEADRRGETGDTRAQRVERAIRYAVWDASGRPQEEFSGTRRGGADPK